MALVAIGRIVNTHGLKGEVRVLPATDFQSDRYAQGNVVSLETPTGFRPLVITRYRPHKGFDLLSFAGLDTIEDVEGFKGCTLYADAADQVTLHANEYRAVDLIGLSVLQGGKVVGRISGIREYPQGDYLEVAKTDGGTALVPFVDALVGAIDLGTGTVTVVEMEGLL